MCHLTEISTAIVFLSTVVPIHFVPCIASREVNLANGTSQKRSPYRESDIKTEPLSTWENVIARQSEARFSPDIHGNELTNQIEAMLRDHSYELSVRPNIRGEPVKIGLSLIIESITDISEKNMDLTFTLRLFESWTDVRLRFNEREKERSIVLPSRLINKLWLPDLYIVGSKSSFIHKTAVENQALRLYSNGKIFYNVKITTTVACQMSLHNFPLDTENCSLIFQSLGHSSEELILEWLMDDQNAQVFMDPRLVTNMPKFRLVHHSFHSVNVSATSIGGNRGAKSQLQISFELKRYLLSVFFQSYFPTMIMVVLAGIGMWIDPRSVPARVAMGVTSVLTISTIITGLKSTLPKVSYITAMDVYLWVSFLFVFSTVLEFCFVNFYMTNCRKTVQLVQKPSQQYGSGNRILHIDDLQSSMDTTLFTRHTRRLNYDVATFGVSPAFQSPFTSAFERKENNLKERKTNRTQHRELLKSEEVQTVVFEIYFRFIYFIIFGLFNAIYWVYYVVNTQHSASME